MAFHIPEQLKDRSVWSDWGFYIAWFLLALSLASYAIFYLKVYALSQRIDEVDTKIAVYGSSEQKSYEKKVLSYKKKIDDFARVIDSHTVSSEVFAFLERVTLPNVWFYSLRISESSNQVSLSGETETMEIFSRQINALEKSVDYVENVAVMSSQVNPGGKTIFTLNLSLHPKIFNYQ